MIVMLDVQVPQECPQAVSDMVLAGLCQDPSRRPTAQQIIYAIQSSMTHEPAGA